MVRTVRNLAALSFLTLSWGVTALWVRSYVRYDSLAMMAYDGPHSARLRRVESYKGLVHYSSSRSLTTNVIPAKLGFRFRPQYSSRSEPSPVYSEYDELLSSGRLGFGARKFRGLFFVRVPHWFVALVGSLLAFALKPKPRLRFSLADLLVLMTMSALLLAGVAGLARFAE